MSLIGDAAAEEVAEQQEGSEEQPAREIQVADVGHSGSDIKKNSSNAAPESGSWVMQDKEIRRAEETGWLGGAPFSVEGGGVVR